MTTADFERHPGGISPARTFDDLTVDWFTAALTARDAIAGVMLTPIVIPVPVCRYAAIDLEDGSFTILSWRTPKGWGPAIRSPTVLPRRRVRALRAVVGLPPQLSGIRRGGGPTVVQVVTSVLTTCCSERTRIGSSCSTGGRSRVGPPLVEVAYYLGGSLRIDDRRARERRPGRPT
jgi:hypothetical protein